MTNLTPEIIESATYPCGWSKLQSLIIENSAYFARATLDEDFPDEIRQSGIDSGKHALELVRVAEQQAETIERLTELMLVTREQAGLLQEAIIRCDSKQDIKSRVVFIIEMINKKVTEINKLEAGEL